MVRVSHGRRTTCMSKNYYDILGIQKNASSEEIKKAFRTLAHQHHPDKKGGDATRFKELSEAYAVLSDDKKRAQYDQYGSSFGQAGAGGENPFQGFDFSNFGFGQQGGGFGNVDFGDIFGDFFGGGERIARGSDITVDVSISFEESIFGVERSIAINKTSACETCKGTGAAVGSSTSTCGTCGGKGKVRETKRSILGAFSTVKTCDACHGKGTVPKERCSSCHGKGIASGRKELTLSIPAGIENGEALRLQGAGEAISGGVPGDLYVRIHIQPHRLFKKEGNNLTMNLSVKLTEALLGAEHVIATLDGDINLKIPAGITHGELLRIRGKGVPTGKHSRGDILIRVSILLPHKLSRGATKLVEELRKEGL